MLWLSPRRRAPLTASLLLASSLLYSTTVSGQSISVAPPTDPTAVPMDNPLALSLLLVALALAGWWQLRRSRAVHRMVAWLLVGTIGIAVYGAGGVTQVLAAVTNAFTNPAGETLSIPINTVMGSGYFTGFSAQTYANNSGKTLRITSIVPPNNAECFAGGATAASKLIQPGPASSPPGTPCSVGLLLQDGDTCRVDVDALCRGLLGTPPTITSVSPNVGAAAGGSSVTLTGTGLTGATSVTFGGVAGSLGAVTATTVAVTTPAVAGTVDVAVETPAGTVVKTAAYSGQYTVGGTVTGLAGQSASLTLLNNGGDATAITVNGSFGFATSIAPGSPYSVTVQTQPSGETCTVTNGSGTINASNVTNIAVNCVFGSGQIFNGIPGVDDVFSGPISGLNGSTFNGNAGDNDAITLTTTGSVTLNNGSTGGTLSNIKVLNLANGSNNISFANGTSGITRVFGGTGDDVIDLANTGSSFLAGTVNLAAGNNSLALENKTYTGSFTAGAGSSTLSLPNGANIAGATVTGFNNLVLASGAAVTMAPTQLAQFTGTVTAAGNETINLASAGSVQALPPIENYVLADGTNTFTSADVAVAVTGGTGNDLFNFTANQIGNYLTSLDGGAGTNALNIGTTATQAINLSTLAISNIGTINVAGSSGAASFTNLNGAGLTLNYTKSTGANTITLGSGGQTLNLLGSSSAQTLIIGGAGVDTINLPSSGGGSETIDMTGATTKSNRNQVKSVGNFSATGVDFFKTGFSATTVGSFIIGNADMSNYLATIGSGLSIVLNNTGQSYVISIQSGTATGTYLFQNTGSDPTQLDNTDFFVKLTGAFGSISTVNMVP